MKLGGFVTQYYQLEYNNGKSNYSQIETINNSQENGGSNFAISISIGGEYKALVGDQTSKAFKQGVKLDNENYIVNIPFQDYEWKISNEESTILDYKVIKAISEKENIIAWFAPDIKVNLGPNQINGLPGLILKSETQLKNKLETKLIFEATKANLNPKKFTKEKPMKGKEIAQEEFKKLQEESNEKMKQSFSSEGVKTKID
ncbi:GLPGLI family protein [Algoriella xinjiangensis]|uniref:GLPGLI family protein n=1 Tax=Algoriella xinjiangensis TaxID=684065 RepID=A0A1I5AJ25_9FLAO|nr:GLPGLI family protein [Algoriella xinjiangensis]SFN62481.1 GLPGLI family protein [Algoriella xinjiangensis]VDH16264.1 GLPGLI family protein [Algoriella xinjiangensis]